MGPTKKPAFNFVPRTTADSSALVNAAVARMAALQNNPMYRPATPMEMERENNGLPVSQVLSGMAGRNVVAQNKFGKPGFDFSSIITPSGPVSPNQVTRFALGPGNTYFQQTPAGGSTIMSNVMDPSLPLNLFHQGIRPTGQQGFIANSGPTKGQVESVLTYAAPKSLGPVNQAEQLKNAIMQGFAAPPPQPRKLAKGGVFDYKSGGTWEVVKEFKGNSHKDGGIDIEIKDGNITRSSGIEPDYIAKSGFWNDLGAGAFGVLKGGLDTVTMGTTAPLTTMAYKGLQDLGGSSEADRREQDSIAGYGQAAGAVLGGIATGGATTGSAIASGSEGLGQGIAKGSESEDWAKTVGGGIAAAGGIAGMATGNAGFGGAAGAAGKLDKAGKAIKTGADWGKVGRGINKLQKIAPYIQMGAGALNSLTAQRQQLPPQQQQQQGVVQQQGAAPASVASAINNTRMNMGVTSEPYTASEPGLPKYGLRYLSKYGVA